LSEGNGHREREEMERALAAAEDAEDAEAARIAQGEVELDNTDFDAGDISRSRGGSGSATPAPGSAVGSPAVEELDRSLDGMGQEDLEEEGEDAEPGSIDEYMLRQVEWDWDYFS
jgi:helicase SWR1